MAQSKKLDKVNVAKLNTHKVIGGKKVGAMEVLAEPVIERKEILITRKGFLPEKHL